ncbi:MULTISPECIES: hypothetical protein [Pseudofrankia]|uniref:hypothetical protein n=1 Tax=Pseudofrankia TaxID=2994363 RepID=UPI000234C2C5|nr:MULTISPECIES: hypothetical protein [Pseudofrankia]OHV35238.1 hypothetical protein BCD49_04550 [Pseudofrankia sp. EUN1h]
MVKTRHFSVLAVDIEKSGSRLDGQLLDGRRAMYASVRGAVEDAGIDWDACRRYDRGDGAQVLFPAEVAKEDVGGPVIRGVYRRLHEYNAGLLRADVPLRMRAVLHAGDLERDDLGWVGYALVVASRLLDSRELRSVLRQARAADLALIVSATWYETVVRHNRGGVEAATYREVTVAAKELVERAWVHVPGYPEPPAPEPGEAPLPPPGPSEPPEPAGGPGGRGSPGGQGAGGFTFGDVRIRSDGDVVGGIVFGDQTVYRTPPESSR